MAHEDQDYIYSLTEDDELARRLCALYVAFSNSRTPISTKEIFDTYYPGLNEDAFRKRFSRDREKLAETGFVIEQAFKGDEGAYWQVDSSSFADGSSLSPDDATVLSVLCAGLVEDPSFAYRNDLRIALAKIDRAYGELTATRLSVRAGADQAVSTLVSCMSDGNMAKISYMNAEGKKSDRVVAPYGQFGLRGRTYFVCAQAVRGRIKEELGLRTFRSDRIGRAKRTSNTYAIPEDFSVDDYVLLPFQIGPTIYEATFRETAEAETAAVSDLTRRGQEVSSDAPRMWSVDVSDEGVAAAWAISAGLVPTAPASLVETWQTILVNATKTVHADNLTIDAPSIQQNRPSRRGRRGGSEETRELMALVSSLSTEGATLTVEGISARLGVDRERARFLLELVLTTCSGSKYHLPISLSDDFALVLSRSQGVVGRAIRLTKAETDALLAALDELGLPDDDPLRLDVVEAFAHEGTVVPPDDDSKALPSVDDLSDTLEACSRALITKASLSFAYQSSYQDEPMVRHAVPVQIVHEDDLWYLDARDLGRRALRTFRIDKMQDVRVAAAIPAKQLAEIDETPEVRKAIVAFTDPHLLETLDWPKLEALGMREGAVVTTIPFYGGTWLPRHLAACGGTVTVDDTALASTIRRTAERLLTYGLDVA